MDQAAGLALSPRRREPEAWVALVEAFLPTTLRSRPYADPSLPEEDLNLLFRLLSKARSTKPLRLDILGYMGTREGKWDALRWLLQGLAKSSRDFARHADLNVEEGFVPWRIAQPNPYGSSKLDEISDIPICFSPLEPVSFEEPGRHHEIRLGLEKQPLRSEWLGQIWATLAYMILHATDHPLYNEYSEKVMSFVLEFVAHLHHIDAIPSTIYTYRDLGEASGIHKPPTLSLMAYRIMAILSDTAWKAQDAEIRKKAQTIGAETGHEGQNLLDITAQTQISGVGEEIWMDLILWCCVEGGFFSEAAWIVNEMLKRKGGMAWKVADWSEVHRPMERKLNWSARAELQIAQSLVNQIGTGLGVSGPLEAAPFVEMGPRTISREVILALIDGLASSVRPLSEIQQNIVACKNLLAKKRSLFSETETLNKTILRLFDPGLVDIVNHPGLAGQILNLAPDSHCISEALPNQDYLEQFQVEDYSAACFGLLHRTLYANILKGDIQATLRTFRTIQDAIDRDRMRRIDGFFEDFRRREKNGNGDQLICESINNIIPSVYPQIPIYILSAFLNLIREAHLYELGNWLLYSAEVDGPFIPPSLYSEVNLQSALLRFATDTENGDLFAQVSARLQTPLAPDILRTLLHCQVTLGKWEAAEEVLRHFQAEPGMGWEVTDIMVIARSILRLETDRSFPRPPLAHAQRLLQELLNGEFNSVSDPSQAADYSDFRHLCQIYRMLSELPGCLHNLTSPPFSRIGRASAPIEISSEAFDTLLEGVVEARGASRGRILWQRWCRPPRVGAEAAVVKGPDTNIERVVSPTIQTLRILMRPLANQGTVSDITADAPTLAWARNMFKDLGLTDDEIEHEFPVLRRLRT